MHQGWRWANRSAISSGLISMLVWQYSIEKAFSHSWPIVILSGIFISLRILTERSHSQLVYYSGKRYLVPNAQCTWSQRMRKVRNDWKQLLQNTCTVYSSLINASRDAHTRSGTSCVLELPNQNYTWDRKPQNHSGLLWKLISSANVNIYKHEYPRLFQLSSAVQESCTTLESGGIYNLVARRRLLACTF